MKRIAIIDNGVLPIPSVLGGAVETLVQLLVDTNEKEKQMLFEIFSIDNADARQKAKEYRYTHFHFVSTSSILNRMTDFIKRCYNFIALRTGLPFVGYCYASALVHFIRNNNNIDAVLLEGSSINADYIKRKTTLPVIQRIHNIPQHGLRHWDDLNAKATDLYLGISNYVCNVLQKDIEGKYGATIKLLYNSIDFEQFNLRTTNEERHTLRKSLNIPANSFLFVFSGRLRNYKGIKELLLAFLESKDKMPNAYLLIVGSFGFSSTYVSTFEKELTSIIYKLEERVIFTGFVKHEVIHQYYQIANVGVFPSTWEEPFALTCLEAIASSLPVIITRSGGMTEIVNEECGIIVENDANLVNSLATAMENIYGMDKAKLENMAQHSALRAQLFDNQLQYKQFVEYVNSEI
ncbi:putative glycosyltransferase [Bacteroides xylanisolvens]|jgi:glycosyltransferase involved in cell wall biosynthesis|nr:putative glycosyltransferase [Bacteroides xylanisolvens]